MKVIYFDAALYTVMSRIWHTTILHPAGRPLNRLHLVSAVAVVMLMLQRLGLIFPDQREIDEYA
jgi:hypothetical protein